MTPRLVVTLLVICIIALELPCSAYSEGSFKWNYCEGQSAGPIPKGIQVKEFKLPDPIYIPGDIDLEFKTEVIGDLIEPITLNVDVWKLVNLYWFTVRTPIPGCCSFENICDMIGGGDASNFSCPVGTAENCIECRCPPLPGKYNTSVTPVVVNIDELPYYVRLFIQLFASGKYETRFTMADGNHDVVLCMETSMEIATSAEDLPVTLVERRRPVLDKLPDYCYRNARTPTQSNDVY